jgi:hypothetical protein
LPSESVRAAAQVVLEPAAATSRIPTSLAGTWGRRWGCRRASDGTPAAAGDASTGCARGPAPGPLQKPRALQRAAARLQRLPACLLTDRARVGSQATRVNLMSNWKGVRVTRRPQLICLVLPLTLGSSCGGAGQGRRSEGDPQPPAAVAAPQLPGQWPAGAPACSSLGLLISCCKARHADQPPGRPGPQGGPAPAGRTCLASVHHHQAAVIGVHHLDADLRGRHVGAEGANLQGSRWRRGAQRQPGWAGQASSTQPLRSGAAGRRQQARALAA